MHAVKNGKFRYLFEYNIINIKHLEKPVFGNLWRNGLTVHQRMEVLHLLTISSISG